MDNRAQKLIEEYKEGNEESLEKLITLSLSPVYNFILKLTGNSEDAYDITQETFIKIWKNIERFDQKKNFKSWLFTIAHNTAIDHLRKRKEKHFSQFVDTEGENYLEANLHDPLPLPDMLFEEKELRLKLDTALLDIPLHEREVMLLRLKENLTFEEIGDILQKPMNTVKSLYTRGLKRLQKVLTMHQT